MLKKILIILAILMLAVVLQAGVRSDTVQWLERHNLSQEWIVLIISMLPIIELRGAIPVGIFMFGFSWQKAALLSVIGNMIPIPFILLFMEGIVKLLRRSRAGRSFTDWLFRRTRKKSDLIEKYETAGLVLFVGIPLPGTGGWTGAFAAYLFGLKFWKSLLYIFVGVLLAAVAVTALCQTGVLVLR